MPMTEKEIAELQEKLGIKTVVDAAKTITDEAAAKAKALADKAKEEAETKRVKALVDEATGEQKEKLETALQLIKGLSDQLGKGDVDGFAKSVQETQDQIKGVKDEIAQLMAAREGKNSVAVAVGKAFNLESQTNFEEEAEKAVLLSFMTKKGVFETEFGAKLEKAVNDSSSIEVSSENYETVFSNRILRDIQKLLVVGAMFQELPMSSKKLTMQIEPDSTDATWVAASTYGQTSTVGNEVKVALTDISFSTFKLAAKAYMTDETEEDAITALLPIIRRHLIEAHVNAIEKAFMGGEDAAPAGKPTGLLTFAKLDNKRIITTATHDGATKVSAKMIHTLRRQLGLKGLRLDALALIVSMDAYYDLLEDDEWQDVNQVGANASVKLQGQLGRIYGMPVVVSSFFPAKATKKEFCAIVYRSEFVVPRQRQVTVEYERRASEQRDAYYVTQRLNLQRYFTGNVVAGTYA